MQINRGKKIVILLILIFFILLNFIYRYPFFDHENGWDSFKIHWYAESIIDHNFIVWSLNPLSLFGFFPLSYSSGIPVILSEMAIFTQITMESLIFLFCIIEAIISVLFSSMLIRHLSKSKYNFYFYILIFTSITILLDYTKWTITTRGPFLIILLLFFYLLARYFKTKDKRDLLFLILISTLLCTIHNLFVFMILFIIAFIIYGFFKNKRSSIINTTTFRSLYIMLVLGFIFLPMIINFNSIFNYYPKIQNFLSYSIYLILSYSSKIGISVVFFLMGVFLIIRKRNHTESEKIHILLLLLFSPFITIYIYTPIPFILITTFFSMYSLKYLITLFKSKINRNAIFSIVSMLIIIWAFSIQNIEFGFTRQSNYIPQNSMTDDTYNTGIYIKNYLKKNESFDANTYTLIDRIEAISNRNTIPQGGPDILLFDYNISADIKISLKPINQWLDGGPYKLDYPQRQDYIWWYPLTKLKSNDPHVISMISVFNIKLICIDKSFKDKQSIAEEYQHSLFYATINKTQYKIYENDQETLWII